MNFAKFCTRLYSAHYCQHIEQLLLTSSTLNPISAMPSVPHRPTTRASNKNTHPGLVDQTTHKPADPSKMAAKATKEAEKIAKATTKKLGVARLKEFEQDTMAREDMLDGTPHPAALTLLVGCTVVPGSDLGIGSSIVKSNMNTDEMNPEKMTYQPGTTMEDDTSSLSATPTSPLKRMYTEVASPKAKKVATTHSQVVSVPQPTMGSKATQCEEDSVTKPDSPPLTA